MSAEPHYVQADYRECRRELGQIVEVSPLWQCVAMNSGRRVWIEKRFSVADAVSGDALVLVMRRHGWVNRWYGERV